MNKANRKISLTIILLFAGFMFLLGIQRCRGQTEYSTLTIRNYYSFTVSVTIEDTGTFLVESNNELSINPISVGLHPYQVTNINTGMIVIDSTLMVNDVSTSIQFGTPPSNVNTTEILIIAIPAGATIAAAAVPVAITARRNKARKG